MESIHGQIEDNLHPCIKCITILVEFLMPYIMISVILAKILTSIPDAILIAKGIVNSLELNATQMAKTIMTSDALYIHVGGDLLMSFCWFVYRCVCM